MPAYPSNNHPAAAWNHEQEGQTVEALIRAAHQKLSAGGHDISPSRLSRLIRRQLRAQRRPQAILDALSYYAMTYRDVTGEDAIHNILSEPAKQEREQRLRERDASLQADIARGIA
ncbi:MAG: hypothetical protein JWP75_4155 [Frondihabitans sp.]|nr:hypothetical protein [Frondihabitans sp.]